VKLGALHPCSLIDYPGRLAAVAFTCGCNLRCPYCHNPGLVAPPWAGEVEEGEVLALLAARRGRLDGLVVTGGEPTLQPDLVPFLERVKELGFLVKLDTNGTRPGVLGDLLGRRLLDHVALDLKDEPAAYPQWLGLREGEPDAVRRSIALLASSGVDHELRTTVALPRIDLDRLARMAPLAAGARRWVLQPYRPVPGLPAISDLRSPGEDELAAMAAWLRDSLRSPCVSRAELMRPLVTRKSLPYSAPAHPGSRENRHETTEAARSRLPGARRF
jgi:pyruvate formate lyase activating enzyme